VADNRVVVGTAIKDRMLELGMSVEQLAALTEISAPSIRQIRNQPDKHRPTPKTLKLISEALGWPSKYLVNILNGDRQEEAAGQAMDDKARLDSLESRMSTQEQLLRNVIMTMNQHVDKFADAVYGTGSDVDVTLEIQDHDDR
jgi:transcriptional regulator with XRE-family HTH domain